MFIPFNDIQSIINQAHSDLNDFLKENLNVPVFLEDFKNAYKEAKKCDANIFNYVEGDDLQCFIEDFLEWIEERRDKENPKPPWKTDGKNEPCLSGGSKCRKFLLDILDKLQRLIEPSDEDGIKIRTFGNQPK